MNITHTGQLDVKCAELVPFLLACDPDEGWEVERSVIAYVFIIGFHCCVDEEVGDSLINGRAVLQGRDEGADVLEGGAADDLRRWVQEEAIVQSLEAIGISIHWGDLGDLGNDIGTCLTHFPLLILGETVVEREKLLRENVG